MNSLITTLKLCTQGSARRAFMALAGALIAASAPAHAETSDTNGWPAGNVNQPMREACGPGGVLVGLNGTTNTTIYSLQTVCVNTTGRVWSSATYTGAVVGNPSFGITPFSRVCPANTVVKSITGQSMGWVANIVLGCQALNEAGEFEGPVTNLAPVGWTGVPGPFGGATCPNDQPARGIFGGFSGALAKIGLSCGTRLEGLKRVARPVPSNLGRFVANREAAIALGKAFFWDVQVASDGKTSCATCHFAAGADNRSKNQIGPGFDRSFQFPGANYQLTKADFPFHKLSDPDNANSTVLRSVDDVVGSSGAFNETFVGVTPGAQTDIRFPAGDPLFQVGGIQTRKLGTRNAPTNINAIFNFRNGRAGVPQFLFNGVNRFGARDENARVFQTNALGLLRPVQVRIDNASLASQAVTPPLNILEMTAVGRQFQHIGKRLLAVRPLANQQVSRTDSRLGPYVHSSGFGLNIDRYEDVIKVAFRAEWWNSNDLVRFNADGTKTIIPFNPAPAANEFRQIEANFSLFWGLAVQLYQATLVSDDTPFDRFVSGDSAALTENQKFGLSLFFGKGRCAVCHKGAEFTDASVRNTLREPMRRIVTRDGRVAVVDQGFHNTAVRPSAWDVADAETDIAGRPISLPALLQLVGPTVFQRFVGITPNLTIGATEPLAVRGAFKTPGLRNVELTAPYFSSGGYSSLRDVVDFYNRGGNFADANGADVDSTYQPLGLTEAEKQALVDFMVSLTDERVRYQRAPFDHPQLTIFDGHEGNERSVVNAGGGLAKDLTFTLPAVGRRGLSAPLSLFLNIDQRTEGPSR